MTPDEYRLEQRLHELGYDREEPEEGPDEDYEYESYADELANDEFNNRR